MTKLVDLVRQNWMALSIGATIFIAKIYPYLGSTGGPLRPEYTFKLIGVGVLFFLTFLHLPIQQILSSLKNWKAHIFIQAFSFIILPIVGSWTLVPFTKWFLEIYWIFTIPPHIATDISQGILLLLCLPSPTTTAAILVRDCKGSESLTILNGTMATIMSFIISPVLVKLLGNTDTADLSLLSSLYSLFTTIVLPASLAFIVRRSLLLKESASSTRSNLLVKMYRTITSSKNNSNIQSAIILLLVYNSFCDTFIKHSLHVSYINFDKIIMFLAALLATFHTLILFLLQLILKSTKLFSPADSVAVLCSSSQKSLSSGLPLIQAITNAVMGGRSSEWMTKNYRHMQAMKFRQNQLTSVMILPLIVYHTVQLVIGGMFATSLRRWAMEGTDSEVASSPRRRQSGILPSRSPAQSRKDIQYNSDFGSGGGGKDENGFLKPANHSGVLHSRSVNQSKEEFDDSVYLGGGSNDVSAKRD